MFRIWLNNYRCRRQARRWLRKHEQAVVDRLYGRHQTA